MTALNGCAGRMNLASLDDPSEIITGLLKTAVLLRVQFGDFLETYDMTEGKYSVLTALGHAGSTGLSQAAVAEELMQSESNVSSLLDRLQQDGLVDRRWSDKDRRKRVLLLTPAGQGLVDQIEAARRGWAEGILSNVNTSDRRTMASVLGQLSIRREVESTRHSRSRSVIRVHKVASKDAAWQEPHEGERDDAVEHPSPQFALEQMLSTLGLAGRFAEDEQ